MTDAPPLASEQITRKALLQIQHSVAQAKIPGNDWRRELSLIANTCEEALSATPAPSDQDASQAQGEVDDDAALLADANGWYSQAQVDDMERDSHGSLACKCGDYPRPSGNNVMPDDGWRSMWCQGCMEHVVGWCASEAEAVEKWNTQRSIELTTPPPAPGATAQDGNYPKIPGSSTPTIPAGMVAVPRTAADLTAIIEAWLARDCDWGEWEKALDALVNNDTPLAAAPKQAEQQGVERIALLIEQAFEQTDADRDVVEWTENGGGWKFVRAAARKIAEVVAAALNAPTGAVEKGEAK